MALATAGGGPGAGPFFVNRADPRVFGRAISYGVLIVATGTYFASRTGHRVLFSGISREHHPALAGVHPYSVHALLIRDDLHDLVGGSTSVVQHRVPGGTRDAARELIRSEDHRLHQLLFLSTEVQVSADPADRDD